MINISFNEKPHKSGGVSFKALIKRIQHAI